nr:putative reverse transcriptase domain-containing protein [Tanacetum cinerariifolium]
MFGSSYFVYLLCLDIRIIDITNRNGNPNENDRGAMPVARECTYQDFMKCQPLNFKEMKGVVGLTRWFEKIETVFHISNCPQKYQVKYATFTLLNVALTWWNSHKRTIGTDTAFAMSWREFMKLMVEVQKIYADRRRKSLEFKVGYKVMLKVSPWKGVIRIDKWRTLNPRYIIPFKILAKVGTLAYRLELSEQLSRVHSTFHVFNLKKCFVDKPLVIPLDEIQIDDKLNFIKEPVKFMDREVKQLKQRRIPIVKVRWNSRRGPEFTWEREDQMKKKATKEKIDCGLYMIMHMELYEGSTIAQWKTGVLPENEKNHRMQMDNLRSRIAAKILLREVNIYAKKMSDYAKKMTEAGEGGSNRE